MNIVIRCFVFCSIILLVNCSDNEAQNSASKKTVIDNQLQAMEKAKGVEQQILDSAAKQREQIDSYQ